MPDLQVSILGPVSVEANGARVSLGGHQQRTLLAALVVRHGHPVPVDVLIDELWGEHPPRTARNSIQRFVSDIRRALGDMGDRLETVDDSYRLRVDADDVDGIRFEALLRAARAASEPGDAAELFEQALRLWSGRPFEGVDSSAVSAERVRLEELRAAAEEGWAQSMIDVGRHAEVVPELERMVAEAPFREERWSLLMLVLYRSGRQAEALRAFQKARSTLVEELGIDPSAGLAELEERILNDDPALRAEPAVGQAESVRRHAGNPYKGLEAFTASDAELFFGREELTERLTRRLAHHGLTALVGPSGSGKSSVVRAGLIPAVKAGAHPGSDTWPIIVMHPGSHPFEELVNASRITFGEDGPSEALEPTQVASWLTQAAAGSSGLILVVDQLEELFVLSSERDRAPFLDLLAALPSSSRVVVTLRADFYDRPLAHPDFSRLMAAGVETVVPLSAAELERAITRPAAALGVRFDPALVAEIIGDVGNQPGALPLLQYALTEVFDGRSSDTITIDDYDSMGGVAGALTARAEDLWRVLTDTQRRMAREVMLRLVAVSDVGAVTRRPLPLTHLDAVADPDAAHAAVDALVASRLVSIDRDPQSQAPVLDVAHEALLTEWTRLQAWVDAEADNLRIVRRLEASAAEWEAAGRDPSFLLTGSRLARIDEWQAESDVSLSTGERAYLDASRERRHAEQAGEQQRRDRELELEQRSLRRLRLLVGVLAAAVIIAAGLTVFAVVQQQQAEQRSAELSVQAAAASALSEVDTNAELSLLLAIAAARISEDRLGEVLPVAEEALHAGLAALQPVATFDGGSAIGYSPDGALVAVGRLDGSIEIFDVETLDSAAVSEGHQDRVRAVEFSPDGRLLASASDDATARLWDVGSGLFLRSLSHDFPVSDVSWSRDGSQLLTGAGTAALRWDVETGDLIGSSNVSTEPDLPVSVGWLSDRVAVAAGPRLVGVMDVDTGEIASATFGIPFGIEAPVCAMAVDPEAPAVYVGDLLGGVQRVAVSLPGDGGGIELTPESRTTFHNGEACALAAGPDGMWAHGGADGRAVVRDADGTELQAVAHGGAIAAVAFAPDGSAIASTGVDEGGVTRLWRLDDGRTGELAEFDVDTPLAGVALRDGTVAAAGGQQIVVTSFADGSGNDTELELTDPGAVALGESGAVALGVPGSSLVEIRSSDGTVVELTGLQAFVSFLQFNDEGTHLLGVDAEGNAVLWDAESGASLAQLETAAGPVLAVDPLVAVDPVSDTFVVLLDAETAVVRAMAGGDEIARFPVDAGSYTAVALESGKVALGSADETSIWATDTGGRTIRLPSALVGAMAFVPGADRLITGGLDGTLVMWDTTDGSELFRIPGFAQAIESMRVSNDGAIAVVGDVGGTVRVLALAPELLLETAEGRATRSLTEAECRSYLGLTDCPDRD